MLFQPSLHDCHRCMLRKAREHQVSIPHDLKTPAMDRPTDSPSRWGQAPPFSERRPSRIPTHERRVLRHRWISRLLKPVGDPLANFPFRSGAWKAPSAPNAVNHDVRSPLPSFSIQANCPVHRAAHYHPRPLGPWTDMSDRRARRTWFGRNRLSVCVVVAWVAGSTGLEPAASGVTGRWGDNRSPIGRFWPKTRRNLRGLPLSDSRPIGYQWTVIRMTRDHDPDETGKRYGRDYPG
jgi:hypothetical protein